MLDYTVSINQLKYQDNFFLFLILTTIIIKKQKKVLQFK